MALLLGKSFLVGGESGLGNYTAMLGQPRHSWNPSGTVF